MIEVHQEAFQVGLDRIVPTVESDHVLKLVCVRSRTAPDVRYSCIRGYTHQIERLNRQCQMVAAGASPATCQQADLVCRS